MDNKTKIKIRKNKESNKEIKNIKSKYMKKKKQMTKKYKIQLITCSQIMINNKNNNQNNNNKMRKKKQMLIIKK